MSSPVSLFDANGIEVFRGTQSPGGGSSPVQLARVKLTDAQIKALPTTAIQLVAAPGSGKMIWPLACIAYCDTTAAAYTNLSTGGEVGPSFAAFVPGDFLTWLQDGVGGQGDPYSLLAYHGLAVASFLPVQSRGSDPLGPQIMAWSNQGYTYENASAVFSAVNTDGDFTGGDPANSLVVAVTYAILDLA